MGGVPGVGSLPSSSYPQDRAATAAPSWLVLFPIHLPYTLWGAPWPGQGRKGWEGGGLCRRQEQGQQSSCAGKGGWTYHIGDIWGGSTLQQGLHNWQMSHEGSHMQWGQSRLGDTGGVGKGASVPAPGHGAWQVALWALSPLGTTALWPEDPATLHGCRGSGNLPLRGAVGHQGNMAGLAGSGCGSHLPL